MGKKCFIMCFTMLKVSPEAFNTKHQSETCNYNKSVFICIVWMHVWKNTYETLCLAVIEG